MNRDMPTMLAASSSSHAYNASDIWQPSNQVDPDVLRRRFNLKPIDQQMAQHWPLLQPQGDPMTTRRVVQVFVADPNENIPLDDCLLYKGPVKVTDATDQELFFELDIKEMLATHNIKRTMLLDKKVKDRTENLEPAKVRDLKMVVVTVASL
jgi:hypothetical protein